MSGHDIGVIMSVAVMVAGAVASALVTDVTRLVLGLGTFLVGVAGAFLVLGSPVLAAGQVFVYVGGVLVLVLFALMMTHRSADERPRVTTRHDVGAAATSLVVFAVLSWVLGPVTVARAVDPVDPGAVADHLLGPGLPAFELGGLLLLLALLGVLVIVKGGEER